MAGRGAARPEVGSFYDELKGFLYAFGGDSSPQKDTVDLLNDMTVEFISRKTIEAAEVSRTLSIPLNHEALMFTVRNDPIKRERITELITSYEEIKALRTSYAKDLAGTQSKKLLAAEKAYEAEAAKEPKKRGRKRLLPDGEGGESTPKPAKKPKIPKQPKDPNAPKIKRGMKPKGSKTGNAPGIIAAAAASSSQANTTEFMM